MCKKRLFSDSIKKMNSEFIFQIFNLNCDGSLSIAKLLGGAGKAFKL